MTSAEALHYILDNPVESALQDLEIDDWLSLTATFGDLRAAGTVVVPTDDALLLIPFDTVKPDYGWEQLRPQDAQQVPIPEEWADIRLTFLNARMALEDLLTDALTAEEEKEQDHPLKEEPS